MLSKVQALAGAEVSVKSFSCGVRHNCHSLCCHLHLHFVPQLATWHLVHFIFAGLGKVRVHNFATLPMVYGNHGEPVIKQNIPVCADVSV